VASRLPFAPTSASAIVITSMVHSSAGRWPLAVNTALGQSLRALMTHRFWLATTFSTCCDNGMPANA